jgi:hypothetical protein
MKKVKILATISVALITVMLSGCTAERPAPTVTIKPSKPSATATPQPTSTPMPTPTVNPEEPEVTTVVIGAQELRIMNDTGEIVETLPYTLSPQQMQKELTEIFGQEPKNEFSGEENVCWYNMTTISWGDFSFTYPGQDNQNGKIYNAIVTGETSNEEVKIESPSGAVIGGDYLITLKNTPAILTQSSSYEGTTYSSLIDEHVGNFPNNEEELGNLAGVGVIAENDVVTAITAPYYIYADC